MVLFDKNNCITIMQMDIRFFFIRLFYRIGQLNAENNEKNILAIDDV